MITAQKIKGASRVSRTGKLWTQYLEQIDLVRLFIRAEGTGDWQMYLYCVKEMLPHLRQGGRGEVADVAWRQEDFVQARLMAVLHSTATMFRAHNFQSSSVSVGIEGMKTMVGSSLGNVKLSRKNRVNPLASMTRSVIIRDEIVPVCPQQLFMRIVWAIHHQGEVLIVYLKYELAPRPHSLFDDVYMRKTAMSSLLQVFSHQCPHRINKANPIIIYGGYILHVVYVVKHYFTSTVVVFDGYRESLSTKEEERKCSASFKCSRNIELDKSTAVRTSQRDFLKNTHNKEQLIRLLMENFEHAGFVVIQTLADADILIVETALRNDTVDKAKENTSINVLSPGNNTTPVKLFNIFEIQKDLRDSKNLLLFFHSDTGDTTSAIFGKGKKKAWKLLEQKPHLRGVVSVFNSPSATVEDLTSTGHKFVMYLYTSENFSSMNGLCGHLYGRTAARQAVTASFDLANLPPTGAACIQHSHRTYLQVYKFMLQ
ncbi:hypothetical protein PR048_002009 [Dryococelus australis]|uniref:Uncharacterized protein n=1 Tax=Dryococelus australis TaxID=614101 RepID=A0ABQ9IKF5_9NEOP|nr:hypothetical protein PR048_002009 [Dryococelus australis]